MAETVWLYGRPVHNHGPAEGRGLDCGERIASDGHPLGWCYPDAPRNWPPPIDTEPSAFYNVNKAPSSPNSGEGE